MIHDLGGTLTLTDMRDWLPFIAQLVTAGVIYGALWADNRNTKQALRDHTKDNDDDFAALKRSDARQWDRLDEHGQRLMKVETKLEERDRGKGAGA